MKMPHPLLTGSQSDYLIQIFYTNLILNDKLCRSRSVGFFKKTLFAETGHIQVQEDMGLQGLCTFTGLWINDSNWLAQFFIGVILAKLSEIPSTSFWWDDFFWDFIMEKTGPTPTGGHVFCFFCFFFQQNDRASTIFTEGHTRIILAKLFDNPAAVCLQEDF